MPTKEQIADALRALAELVDLGVLPQIKRGLWGVVAARSQGRGQRIVAAMTDVSVEPYETDTTKYLIHRGKLLDAPVEVMESQDD